MARFLGRRKKQEVELNEDEEEEEEVLLEPFGERPARQSDDESNGNAEDDHNNQEKPRRRRDESSPSSSKPTPPSLEPYVGKLERFELFSTNQCYYLIACDKNNTAYRILKMDRTLIERPPDDTLDRDSTIGGSHAAEAPHADAVTASAASAASAVPSSQNSEASGGASTQQPSQSAVEATHKAKPTLRPLSDFLTEDPHIYSQEEIQDMLDMIHHGNQLMRQDQSGEVARNSAGGLKPIAKAYGIVGFVRFLDCYYLTLITRRAKVGSIGGNGIYTIKSTETFPLKPAEQSPGEAADTDFHTADPSAMLLNMWNRGKRSVGLGLTNREIAELRYQGLYQVVDLHKNFYFSYTYDMTRSLQDNFLAAVSQPFPPPPIKDMYAWNYFLTRELDECCNSLTSYHWVMPIIHGAFVQRKLNDYGRSLNLILLARRSRHFAGTRYLKRGVSDRGKVANDVEHEQIVHDESSSASSGSFSSFLQVRGSIPTYWTQESSVTMPKPPIELNRVDPTYQATQLHFEDLFKRYGGPIVVLDLVKQSEKREREVRVGNEFRHAIDYMNQTIDDAHKIRYCALDYSHISKHRNLDVSSSLNEVSTWAVNQTGFFCSAPRWKIMEGGRVAPFDESNSHNPTYLSKQLGVPVFPLEQKGVLRTNCIDCLDRTNVAQFSAGVEALEQQLVVMGIRSSARLDPSSTIIRVLIDMYVEVGDYIALQYGGSEAHKKVSNQRSEIPGPIGKHKELLTSIRRYYSNAFTDRLKQDAMNLFLGYYIPYEQQVPLWEIESDYYLHNFHVKTGKGTVHTMKTYQRAFGIDWKDEEIEAEVNQKSTGAESTELGSPLRRQLPPRPNMPPRPPVPNATTNKAEGEEKKEKANEFAEPLRIGKVRRRCNAQNDALSVWWKAAIQTNIQQRMWMQLVRNPSESLLPPRFERQYQPDKLAQFDRFFARSWATPVRRSHSAQHAPNDENEPCEITEYRKTITDRINHAKDLESTQHGEVGENKNSEKGQSNTIGTYVDTYGYEPRIEPSLKRFIKPHDASHLRSSRTGNTEWSEETPTWVGNKGQEREQPCAEYLRYVNGSQPPDSSNPYRKGALEEFSKCLHDTFLHHNDVDGIRKLAESAHVGATIQFGPYRGLNQNESAVEITTIVHEQYNVLSKMRSREQLPKGWNLVDKELNRRGVDTAGVKESVASGWDRVETAEQQYSELLRNDFSGCRRSDLTTTDSMKVYLSFADASAPLSQSEMTYMLGEKPDIDDWKSSAVNSYINKSTGDKNGEECDSTFVSKAAKLGIAVKSHSDIKRAQCPSLFNFDHKRSIASVFEQINEDLYARKDNKFIVFNGVGVDSWKGTLPVTRISDIEEDLLLLSS